jgi:hypothetical protein
MDRPRRHRRPAQVLPRRALRGTFLKLQHFKEYCSRSQRELSGSIALWTPEPGLTPDLQPNENYTHTFSFP